MSSRQLEGIPKGKLNVEEIDRLNWNAVHEAINQQNIRIAELTEGHKRTVNALATLQQQMQNLTAQFAQLMNEKLGGGPTA